MKRPQNAPSQADRILQRLKRTPRKWVGLPTLAKVSGSLTPATRISNLRERGHHIENRTTRLKNGGTASFYRIL